VIFNTFDTHCFVGGTINSALGDEFTKVVVRPSQMLQVPVSPSRDSGVDGADVGDDEDFLFLFLFADVVVVERAETTTKIERNFMVVLMK